MLWQESVVDYLDCSFTHAYLPKISEQWLIIHLVAVGVIKSVAKADKAGKVTKAAAKATGKK